MISIIVRLLIACPRLESLFVKIRKEYAKEIGKKNYEGYLVCLKRLKSDK
tara:strand:+ start:231 stop:380 length:150 start_codon:yes stop_codon:yes gene_type:complete